MNTFEENQIIVSPAFNALKDIKRFEFNAFKHYMSHKTYAEALRRAIKDYPALIPFVIKKVTKCFVFFTVNDGKYIWQKKIHNDENGQYFIYNKTKIYCENLQNESILKDAAARLEEYGNALTFAKKTIEIDDYGYTWATNDKRVTSIDELEETLQPWK